MTPKEKDFSTLVSIVADVFRVTEDDIMGPPQQGPVAEARHLVGAIWSECHTLSDTARRLNRGNHWTIQYSRRRVERMLLDKPGFDHLAREVLSRLASEAPQIMRNYEKTQDDDDFSCAGKGAA